MKSDKDKENGWKYLENEDFIDFWYYCEYFVIFVWKGSGECEEN